MNDLLNDLERLESAAVADVLVAMGLERQVLAPTLKPIGSARLSGRALCAAGREGPMEDAIPPMRLDEAVRPGDVVLISSGGYEKGALVGDNMVTSMVQRGARGFVLDSGVRDTADLSAGPVAVWCRYSSPVNGHKFWSYTSIGGSITMPGVWGPVEVRTGDYVVGDDDGISIIPADHAMQVITDSLVHMVSESTIKEALLKGVARDVATHQSGRLAHVKPLRAGAAPTDE